MKIFKVFGKTVLSILQWALLCSGTVIGTVAALVAVIGLFTAALVWVILNYLNPRGCATAEKLVKDYFKKTSSSAKEEKKEEQ